MSKLLNFLLTMIDSSSIIRSSLHSYVANYGDIMTKEQLELLLKYVDQSSFQAIMLCTAKTLADVDTVDQSEKYLASLRKKLFNSINQGDSK